MRLGGSRRQAAPLQTCAREEGVKHGREEIAEGVKHGREYLKSEE